MASASDAINSILLVLASTADPEKWCMRCGKDNPRYFQFYS